MKALAIALLATAGCIATSPGEYRVDAVAELAPADAASPAIEGPIEFLATGMPSNVADAGVRTVAAYRVRLPHDVTAIAALLSAASCADRTPLFSDDDPVAVQDIGLLRRVGDETHFFAQFIQVGDRTLEADTETATVFVSRRARFPRIVIAISPVDFHLLACGPLIWR